MPIEMWVIFAILALALGPIFWMMPSPNQQRLTDWRDHAMRLGLQVKIADLPFTHRLKVRQTKTRKGAYYAKQFKQPQKKNDPFYYCLTRIDGEPEWVEENKPALANFLTEQLSQLPSEVVAIDYSNIGVGVYWQEKGDIESIDKIAEVLQHCIDTLNHKKNNH